MSLVGKKIESFELDAYRNEEFVKVTEADLMGHFSVLCFYPADFSFVCPTELEDLQNVSEELGKLDCQVFSCSTDTHFVHKAWHDHSEKISTITYTMIGDPAHQLCSMFDVIGENGLAQRGTFIIDPDGVVQAFEVTADGIGRNASQLVDKIKAARYIRKHPGEVCPAKWKEGEETLAPSLDLVGKI
ncbi:MAG: alkyl hydroperoxide reductase subunit C [Eubacteriales bacterium]|nr:alkyl hydroperoxide reductase subunit C [Eubacteriales bacterium]